MIGDDYASVPPAQALGERQIVQNVRGYSIYGHYGKPNPPAALIEAVRKGEIDVAIAWGPLAGYFAANGTPVLEVTPLQPADRTNVRLAFDISMGMRRADEPLRKQLNQILSRRRVDIQKLLARYHIVTIPSQPPR